MLLAGAAPAEARERLVLAGGGDRPREAMARFVEWSGGTKARLLVVTWASGEPQASWQALRADLGRFDPARVEQAPTAPLAGAGRDQALDQIRAATGVFFSGGDQNRVMDVLQDTALLTALRRRYQEGTAFGGTSAGAAIMSNLMITGEGDFTVIDGDRVAVRVGLGLLPGVIVDQHFVKRLRENRLFGLVLKHPRLLGVGVDEDAALLVRDNRHAEVVGGTVVMVDGREGGGRLTVQVLRPRARYDLRRRRALR